MASTWPNYARYMQAYERQSRKLNTVLYEMCGRMPAHADERAVWAKVWIIGRSYATGIERHAGGGLGPIVTTLRRSARWLDAGLEALREHADGVPGHERLSNIAQLHGRAAGTLARHTRDRNRVRSFVSKYLHFHAPVVPIYDSVVSSQLRARDWYPWRREWSTTHPPPRGADTVYWRHCIRVGRVVEDWRAAGLEPTARYIDYYVYRWAKERQRR